MYCTHVNCYCRLGSLGRRGDSKTLYRRVKELSGGTKPQTRSLRKTDGHMTKSHDEEIRRWGEHFEGVLNCDDPETCCEDLDDLEDIEELEIDKGDVSREDIQLAIKNLKIGKMIKHGGAEMLVQLTKLCNKAWRLGRVPKEWRNGIIIPLPKKGDIRECSNWRGITLLSTPGKIMATVILNRMRDAIDEKLRQEQAGFRPGRSCCEQIFTLRQIIEKTLMWQTPVVINFVDFRKACDSVHRESIWKILKTYGVPTKIIDLIKNFYEDSLCAVRCRGELGEWFRVVSGVRQGCVLSPLIFAIVVDWIMSRATGENTFGLKWTEGERLTDLDFADDIALLDNTWDGIKQLTERVQTEAAKVGLPINPDKTKVMKIGK